MLAQNKCYEVVRMLNKTMLRKKKKRRSIAMILTKPSGMELNPWRYQGERLEQFKDYLIRRFEQRTGKIPIPWNKKTHNSMIIELKAWNVKDAKLPMKMTNDDDNCDDSEEDDCMSTEC